MSQLALILSDFHPPRSGSDVTGLPRLPALERALSRGLATPLRDGWRPWLAGQLCGADVAAPAQALAVTAPAGIAMAGWVDDPGERDCWFATPVHYVVGINSLHLHPAGLLQLDASEQQALCASFASLFGESGLRLYPTGRRDLLLAGVDSAAVRSTDPSRWLGTDPSAGFPVGAGAAGLRRLGTEMELWLHDHPVNRGRVQHGELPVSTLWLWGGGPVLSGVHNRETALRASSAPAPVLYAEDVFAEGLARARGETVRSLAGGWQFPGDSGHQIAILPTATADPLEALRQVDDRWIAPALAHLAGGRLQQLDLIVGEYHYQVTRARLRRFWRTSTPWWSVLMAEDAA